MKRVINSGSTHPLTIFSHITTTSYSIGTVYTVHYINIIHTVQCTYSDLAKFEIISFFLYTVSNFSNIFISAHEIYCVCKHKHRLQLYKENFTKNIGCKKEFVSPKRTWWIGRWS